MDRCVWWHTGHGMALALDGLRGVNSWLRFWMDWGENELVPWSTNEWVFIRRVAWYNWWPLILPSWLVGEQMKFLLLRWKWNYTIIGSAIYYSQLRPMHIFFATCYLWIALLIFHILRSDATRRHTMLPFLIYLSFLRVMFEISTSYDNTCSVFLEYLGMLLDMFVTFSASFVQCSYLTKL
jgi:hypothetical protein